MRVDVHCHVGQRCRPCQPNDRFSFEPTNEHAPYDAYFSDVHNNRLAMHLARWYFKIPRNTSEHEADAMSERVLLGHILGADQIDRVVVLAFDQYHTSTGEPVVGRTRQMPCGTDLYVSNTYVRQLWKEHPQRILFAASIHPYRHHQGMAAVDMLDEVAAAGAVLIKWLPLTQNIDARDPRTIAFLRRAGEIGMPVLVHYGCEYTLGTFHPEFRNPADMLQTLRELRQEGKMPPVIFAHAATPLMWPIASGKTFRTLTKALLGEFFDAPVYTDISALAVFNKARWLKRLIKMPAMHQKMVYGSDFPIPTTPIAFRFQLGRQYRQIMQMDSWIDRDIAIKIALGIREDTMTRGSKILSKRIAAADAITGQPAQ